MNPLKKLIGLVTPPSHLDEEAERVSHAVAITACALMAITVFPLLRSLRQGWADTSWVLGISMASLVVTIWMNRKGRSFAAARLLSLQMLAAALLLIHFSVHGFRDLALLLFPAILVVAALLLEWPFYVGLSITLMALVGGEIILEIHKLNPEARLARAGYDDLVLVSTILGVTAVAVGLLAASLRSSLSKYRQSTSAFRAALLATTSGGDEFFGALVRELARALGVRSAAIARTIPGSGRLVSVAAWAYGGAVPNSEFDRGELADHLGAKSLLEIPLIGASGETLGLLAVPNDAEATRGELEQSLLTIFAARASVELERQASETQLRASEDRYRTLVQSQGEGVLEVAGDLGILMANPSAEAIFGVKGGGLTGRPLVELVPPEATDALRKWTLESQRGERSTFDLEVIRTDGERRQILVTGTPRLDGSGRLKAAIAVFRDVTESRRLEARIRLLAHGLKCADSCITITDVNERLIYVNDAFLRTYGYSESELIGQHISLVRSPRSQISLTNEILPATLRGGWRGELWNRAKDGREFAVSLETSVVRDEKGAVVATVGVARDITERRRAEDALRESERRFRSLLLHVRLAALMSDAEGVITFCNNYLLKALGRSREELIGHSIFEFLDPEHQDMVRKGLAESIEAGEVAPFLESAVVRKDGKRRWIQWNNTALRDHEGRIIGFASLGADVTEHRALQEQYLQSQKLESVGRLAGGVAHDFNNLLTVINGYSDMLLARLDSHDGLRHCAEQIRSAGERATELTQQLLAFSRRQMSQPRPVDVNTVVRDAAKMYERLIGEDVVLRTVLDPNLGVVLADPGHIHQILVNLVVNARDSMPQGGRLTIETGNVEVGETAPSRSGECENGPYVFLRVTDTGTGMDEEVRRHVFEPFFTTKGQGRGTGLGLATVYGIVRQNGGCISLETSPGQGSSFTIQLPRIDTDSEVEAEEAKETLALDGTETVLVVEDQEAVRKLAGAILEAFGYKVLEAEDGTQAAMLAGQHEGTIHLLLTDVVLPGMNGREVAEQLLKTRPGMKVLYTSGYSEEVITRRGVLEPGVAYIPKPFSPDGLAARVRSVLGSA
jgi:PAS domain S-box-containing protein